MKYKLSLFFSILIFYSLEGMFSSMVLPEYAQDFRVFRFLCDILTILLAVTVFLKEGLSITKKLLLIFILVSSCTYIFNLGKVGLLTHLNGLREPLIFFSALIFIEHVFSSKYRNKFIKNFSIFLIVFAISQLPATLIEFSLYGAGDKVGGTFGTIGGSGLAAMLLFLISFYLIVKYNSGTKEDTFNINKLLIISLLLIPCAFNETKITFILLFLYFILILDTSFQRGLFKVSFIIFFSGLFFYFFYYYYTKTVMNPLSYLNIDFINKYFFTYKIREGYISRYAMIPEMFYVFSKNVGAYIFGIGYGIFKGQNILGTSQVGGSTFYLWYRSQILLFSTWMQGGISFILVLFFTMFSFMKSEKKIIYSRNVKRFKLFLLFVLLIMWGYNCAILTRTFSIIISYFMIWSKYGKREIQPLEVENRI